MLECIRFVCLTHPLPLSRGEKVYASEILRFALNDKKEKSVLIRVICGESISLRLKDRRVSHSIHIGDDGSRIVRYLVAPADEAVAIVGHGD